MGASWKAAVTVYSNATFAAGQQITINEDDIPEVTYVINAAPASVHAEVGDANDAASFTDHAIDTDCERRGKYNG